MEDFPTGIVKLILSSQPTSFMLSTSRSACTLLFALQTEYSNGMNTHNFPDDLSTHGPDKDWPGRPPSKRGSRSLDFKNCRDSSSDASSSRGSSSSGQKSRQVGKGPYKCATPEGDKDDKTDTDAEKQKTPRQVVHSFVDVSSGYSLHQVSRSEPATDDRALLLSPATAYVRQTTVAAVAPECDAAHVPL